MPAVNALDGIKYGFRLLGYFALVAIAAFVIVLVGMLGGMGSDGGMSLFGALFALIGVLVFYAGSLGVMYKVIADGVKVGIESAG